MQGGREHRYPKMEREKAYDVGREKHLAGGKGKLVVVEQRAEVLEHLVDGFKSRQKNRYSTIEL